MTTIDVDPATIPAPPPPPGAPPADVRLAYDDSQTPTTVWWWLGGSILAGAFGQYAIDHGAANVAGALSAIVAAATLLRGDLIRHRHARVAVWMIVPFAGLLVLRASAWLVVPNLIVIAALATFAASSARSTDPWTVPGLRRAERLIDAAARSLGLVAPATASITLPTSRRMVSLTIGVGFALPIGGTLIVLLAQADAVFASFFRIDLGLDTLAVRVAWTLLCALPVLGLIRAAWAGPLPEHRTPGQVSALPLLVVLGTVSGVLSLFALAQVVAEAGAAERILRTEGLTFAEHARRGFFQLAWVVGIVLVVVSTVHRVATPAVRASWIYQWTAASSSFLALGVAATAFRRMLRYGEQFGLTMLRLAVMAAIGWFAVLLVTRTVQSLGFGTDTLLRRVAFVSGIAIVGIANLGNPEAFVARFNIDRFAGTHRLDIDHLLSLGSDATPTIIERVDRLDLTSQQRSTLLACAVPKRPIMTWNASRHAAHQATRPLCRSES